MAYNGYKDVFKDTAKTEISARVKEKHEETFLRFDEKTGAIRSDSHFLTTFVLPSGDEVTSYSKKHFSSMQIGNFYEINVCWCRMPNGEYLLYV